MKTQVLYETVTMATYLNKISFKKWKPVTEVKWDPKAGNGTAIVKNELGNLVDVFIKSFF